MVPWSGNYEAERDWYLENGAADDKARAAGASLTDLVIAHLGTIAAMTGCDSPWQYLNEIREGRTPKAIDITN